MGTRHRTGGLLRLIVFDGNNYHNHESMAINYHAADCGLPPADCHLADRNIKLDCSSTLEGSVLTLTCENEMSLNSTNKTTLNVTCDSNGSWIPNPADFIQSCSPFSTTVSPTTGTNYFSIIIKDILYTFKISFIVCLLI